MTFSPILIWFLIGLALILSEFMLPGVILVFFGLGAWITTLTIWLGLTAGWGSQLLTFAISSVLLLVVLRRWFRARLFGYVGDDQSPEQNIDDMAGQKVTVMVDVEPGQNTGKVEYKGAAWSARSDEFIAAGSRAVIVAADGITLKIRPE